MKYLPLSEQDEKLLLNLHQFIYLSKELIDKYIYVLSEKPLDADEFEKMQRNKEKSNYRRLPKLEEYGYITSFTLYIKEGHKRPSNVYTLTKFGVDCVREQLTGIVHWKPKWSREVPPGYMHALTLAEVIKNYEAHAEVKGIMVKEWVQKARAYFKFDVEKDTSEEMESHIIRPDGIRVLSQLLLSLNCLYEQL